MAFTQSLIHLPQIGLTISGPLPDPHIMASREKLKDTRPQPGICINLKTLLWCHVCGQSSAKALAARILRRTPQTDAMKRGLDLEPEILKPYSDLCDVSVMQCGFIIHPDAPHLGASPDAKVFNPKETLSFGLYEIPTLTSQLRGAYPLNETEA